MKRSTTVNDTSHTIGLAAVILCSCGGAAFELAPPDSGSEGGTTVLVQIGDGTPVDSQKVDGSAPDVAAPDAGSPDAYQDAATIDAAPPVIAQSCSDIRASGATSDGVYTIDVDGPTGPKPPFNVYCRNMATVEPTEYLELPANVDAGLPNSNFSTWAGWAPQLNTPCFPLTSTLAFTKIRLIVPALTVDTSDRTFAYLEQGGGDGGCVPAEMGYAYAGSCLAGGDMSGRGNVDLVGTPFRLTAATSFSCTGYSASGSGTVSADRKHVDLVGEGYAGWCTAGDGGLGLEF